MSEQQYAYPFDPTGRESSNLILNERHVINPPDYNDFYFVVPLAGPFFKENLVITHWPSGQELFDGVDYVLGYQFLSASRATAKPIYGAISLYDRELTGVLEVTYQTLGGPWTINEEAAAEMLANAMSNPRTTTWEQVVEQPATFPVIDHEWNLDDLVGMAEVNDALDAIRIAIETAGSGENIIGNHLTNYSNPHQVTKAQVGLGLLSNFPLASINEARDGGRNDRYMTASLVKSAISFQVADAYEAHAVNVENPHGVTKAQVGLGEVANYPPADSVIARDGSSDAHYMTPAGVTVLLEDKIGTGVVEHIESRENPHGVTAAQVGLGSVPNYPMATIAIAEAGNAPDYFMSPYHTKLLINDMVSTPLGNHLNSFDNPHQVSKLQVGLGNVDNFGTASEVEAKNATAQNRFMTPYLVRLTINELVGDVAGAHINNENNPHNVTAAQLNLGNVDNYATATATESTDGVRNDRFMTPQGVRSSISTFISNSYGNLGNRLGELESNQTTNTQTLTDHVGDLSNPHGVTIEQVGGYATLDIDNFLIGKLDTDATAANSLLLEGQSLQQIRDSIATDVENTYVTQNEVTILTENLSTSFEDSMWELSGNNVIRFESGNLSAIFSAATDIVEAVDGDGSSRWVAGGTGGLIARSVDNGLTWSQVSPGITEDVTLVKYLTGTTWLLATATGRLYRSTDVGVSWTEVDLSNDVVMPLREILYDGAQQVYLVASGGIRESNDTGVTFGLTVDLSSIPPVTDATRVADGTVYFSTEAGVYRWDSVNGTSLVAAVPNTDYIELIASDADGHIVAVGGAGAHHRYSPVNNGWQTLEHNETLKDILVAEDGLWAALTEQNTVIRSIDGGRFWGQVPTSPTEVTLHSLGASQTGWIAAGAGGDVYLSID